MAKDVSRDGDRLTQPTLIKLANGLRVVLQRTTFAPVVSMALWVEVGSADELPAEAGLAHLHEHMIFKGTARRGVGQIAAEVEAAGGDINAFTSFDSTCYYLTVGKDETAVGLDILADAIFQPAFAADELKKEIQVVLEELAMYRDLPNSHLAESTWNKVFAVHPYGRPIIGTREVLQGLRRKEVLAFYRRHYHPQNLVLAVAGDFDPDGTLRLIRRLFGKPQAAAAKRRLRPDEPLQKKFRGLVLRDPIHEAHLYLAFPGPAWNQPFAAELDILATILSAGESSRLEQRVKSVRQLVFDVSTHLFAPKDPGLFAVDATTTADKVRPAIVEILQELYRLREQYVTAPELARAKKLVEASFVGRRETVGGIGQGLGYSVILTGDIHLEDLYLEQMRHVTRDSLRQAANEIFRHERLTGAVLLPKGKKMSLRELESIARPIYLRFPGVASQAKSAAAAVAEAPSSPAKRKRRNRLLRTVLPNGVRLLVNETHHAPLVYIRTGMLGGLRYEPARLGGLSGLTSRLLARGTEEKSALQFAREVDDLAAGVRGVSGFNTIGIAGDFLAVDFAKGMQLVAEASRRPAFSPTEIKRQKQMVLGRIAQRKTNLQALVRDLFAEKLYGEHPYGRTLLGDERTVPAIKRADVQAYWDALLDPANLVISISGDVEYERAYDLVGEAFGDLPPTGFAPLTHSDPAPPQGLVFAERIVPKEQAHIQIGWLGCNIGSRDEVALQLLSAVLSGQGGRLFLELRDRRNLAYSVYSFQQDGVERGAFGVYIATGNQTADLALTAMREEIDRVLHKPPRGRELQRAKRYLIGSHRLHLQTNASLAQTVGLNELLGPGYRAHQRFAAQVQRLTDEDIARVTRRYLSAENMVVAIIRG
ncbi:MAG TPA: pitrilysin family protein [bacterium]|nr:pitrilysin family protein [bacterium]